MKKDLTTLELNHTVISKLHSEIITGGNIIPVGLASDSPTYCQTC